MEELLTRKEVAKILKVSYRTILNWENQGILKPWKLKATGRNARVRYKKSDIEKLIENNYKGGENGE